MYSPADVCACALMPTVGRDAARGQPAYGRVPLPGHGLHRHEEELRHQVEDQLHPVGRRRRHRRQAALRWHQEGACGHARVQPACMCGRVGAFLTSPFLRNAERHMIRSSSKIRVYKEWLQSSRVFFI